MNKDEALNLALEALQWSYGGEPMPTKEREAMDAIRQVLDQLPEATKMIDNVYIRYWVQDTMESGHWATTDIMERTTAEILLSGVYGNTFERGEIVEQSEMPIDRAAWSDVEDATKWVDDLRGDEPDLLNQTCCGCGRSGGLALYCGWCWSKGEHVADVSTSEERVPISDKQRRWVGLTTEQRNNIMQKHGNDWKRYIEEVERQLQENNS